jgi:hypothetical protein
MSYDGVLSNLIQRVGFSLVNIQQVYSICTQTNAKITLYKLSVILD